MKQWQYQQHLSKFSKLFLEGAEQSKEHNNHLNTLVGLFDDQQHKKQSKQISMKQIRITSEVKESIIQQISNKSTNKTKQNQGNIAKRKFSFHLMKFVFEIILAYILTFSLFYLSRAFDFPFFQCLSIVLLATLFENYYAYFFVLLGLPILIANKFLNATILTWPAIFICYLSTYVVFQKHKVRILWLADAILLAIYGFLLLPFVYDSFSADKKYIFYFTFPFINCFIKLVSVCLKHFIKYYCLFLCQFDLFILGIQYGILIKVSPSTVQFWFMLIMLTLDIINNRYKTLWNLLAALFHVKNDLDQSQLREIKHKQVFTILFSQKSNTFKQRASGNTCLHSFHIVLLIYLILGMELSYKLFGMTKSYSLQILNLIYLPVVVYCFFSAYEFLSFIKIRQRQELMIYGQNKNSWFNALVRSFNHCIGFLLFYFGLIISFESYNG